MCLKDSRRRALGVRYVGLIKDVYILLVAIMFEIIDWEQALEQVADDQEFLEEILGDLITETEDALGRIVDGVTQGSFTVVMKAAHQVKGSTAYLYCAQVQETAKKLQALANEGVTISATSQTGRDSGVIWSETAVLFATLKEEFAALKEEIQNHKWEGK